MISTCHRPRSVADLLRKPASVAAVIACCGLLGQAAQAEKADKQKPINVEADRMQYDDLKQINVFTGNVTLTKGTIVIKGDKVVIRQDPEGYQYGTAFGNPASFRQKREGNDQYIEGYGLQLDYDGKTEIVRFQQKALLKRLEKARVTDEVHGSLIVYESLSEFFTVESTGGQAVTAANPGGRVHVVIQPKNTTPDPADAPAPVTIKPSNSLTTPTDSAPKQSSAAVPAR
jgi:lipopolysaccharide export system protein LptA